MRNLKAGLADPLVSIHKDIQVQGARAIANCGEAITPEFLFQPKQPVEQGTGVEIGFESHDGVEETGLVGETDGFGGVERGAGNDASERFQPFSGGGKGGFGVSGGAVNVRAHTDVGGMHRFQSIGLRREGICR